MLAGDGRHGLLEHAVDAVLDEQRVVVGLEVDVGGAAFERGEDGRVDETDDRRDVVIGRELLDGDVLVGGVFTGEHVEGKAFGGFVEHALRLLRLLEEVGDLRERGDAGDDARAEQTGDLVEHHEARGVGDGDSKAAVLRLLERHEVVAEHHVDRNGLEELVLDLEVLQVDELGVIAARETFGALGFGERVVGERGCYGGSHLVQTPCVASVQLAADVAQTKDRHVERDQNDDDDEAHGDEDQGFDKAHDGGELGLHVLFEELGDGVEHGRQRAGGLANLDHLDGELREDAGLLEAGGETLAFADALDRSVDSLGNLRDSMERAAVSRLGPAAGRR